MSFRDTQRRMQFLNCLCHLDYKQAFGEVMGDHLWGKFQHEKKGNCFKLLCDLDFDNLDLLEVYYQRVLKERAEEQLAEEERLTREHEQSKDEEKE